MLLPYTACVWYSDDDDDDGAQCRAWRGCARVVLACTRLTTRRVYTVFLLVIYIIPIICRRRRPSAVVIVERGSLCATMYVYYSIYIYMYYKCENGCRRRSSRQGVFWWVHAAHIILLYYIYYGHWTFIYIYIYRYIIHTPVRTMCGGCCCTAQRRRRFFSSGVAYPLGSTPS